MARSTAAFERVINLAIKNAQPPEVQKRHAEVARKGLADHLRTVPGGKPHVTTFVDGRKGASEDSVKAYGVIRYEFTRLAEIAAFALRRAQELSPVGDGRGGGGDPGGHYRDAWFAMVGGRQVAPEAIPAGAPEVVITNDKPFHRKLEMTVNAASFRGKAMARLPAGIVERVRQEILREFGKTLDVSVSFITLQGGYTLKGRQRTQSRKALADWYGVPEPVIDGWKSEGQKLGSVDLRRVTAKRTQNRTRQGRVIVAGETVLAARKDTAVGQQMTYPALILKPL